jgi:hypothetical protein
MHLIITTARWAAVLAGVIGITASALVIGGEVTQGEDFMTTASAQVSGWLSFASPVLIVVALVGFAVVWAGALSRGGAASLLTLVATTATTVGAAATLALVVPTLADVAPELAVSPPVAVPATFIVSGVVMAVAGLALAVSLKPRLTQRQFVLLVVASLVCMVPLPSRSFLLAFALVPLLHHTRVEETDTAAASSRPAYA